MKEAIEKLRTAKRVAVTTWDQVSTTLLRRLNNPRKQSSPLFVVGCGRSGTNMLIRQLARSFEVELYNENHPAAFEQYRIKPLPAIAQLTADGFARVKLYKPILDTHMSCRYLSFFPNAKIIFIFRHFDDVINSAIRRFGPNNFPSRVESWVNNQFAEFAAAPPPRVTQKYVRARWHSSISPESAIALYWLFYNRLYFDLGLNCEKRVTIVQYETLVAQPEVSFRRLCRFVGIQYRSEMARGVFASSVGLNAPPQIANALRNDGEQLLQQLSSELKSQRRHLSDE